MSETSGKGRLRKAGVTAWRTLVLLVSALLVLVLFGGMAYLVYRGKMSDGPLVLFAGVILGYVLRLVQEHV
jgi:hypothetical protein